jgi:choline dehydrogenase
MPSDMLNATYAAEAAAAFDAVPAQGPYTLAMSNSALFISLPNITADFLTIVNKIRTQAGDDASAAYLPPDYRSNPAMIEGYKHQLSVLADFYANPEAPSMETPFATGMRANAFILHPLSRGTVRLNLTNHLQQPILDYRSGSNPIDFDVLVAHLKYLRRMVDTPAMHRYGAIEVGPGPALQTDEALVNYIRDQFVLSHLHPCCTAAMMPKEKGGVVGPDLKVHGAAGLRVIDMSILPVLPSSHLSAAAYAVGEKVRNFSLSSKPISLPDRVIELIIFKNAGCRYHHQAMVDANNIGQGSIRCWL